MRSLAPVGKFADGRGELYLGRGGAIVPDAKGLRIRGELSELDVAPWQEIAGLYAGGDPGGSAKQLLNSVDLQIGKLTAMGTTLDDVRVQLQRNAAAWALSLDSALAKGTVRADWHQHVVCAPACARPESHSGRKCA